MYLNRIDAVIALIFLAVVALSIAVAVAQSDCPPDCSPLVCRDDVRCMGAGVRR